VAKIGDIAIAVTNWDDEERMLRYQAKDGEHSETLEPRQVAVRVIERAH